MDNHISFEDVDQWVGNHGYQSERDAWMIRTLQEIANGEYDGKQLRDDIELKG